MKEKEINHQEICNVIVKGIVRIAKANKQYHTLRNALHKNVILSFFLKQSYNKDSTLKDVKSYNSLAIHLKKHLDTHIGSPKLFKENHPNQLFFKYVTEGVNFLIRFIFEVNGVRMPLLGQMGQNTYNFVCQTLLGESFKDEENNTKPNELTAEDLRSKIFNDFLTACNKNKTTEISYDDYIREALNVYGLSTDQFFSDPNMQPIL